MSEPKKSEWLSPPNMIALVMALGTVGSFWVSFDRRVTNSENGVIAVAKELDGHKQDEGARLDRMEVKLDYLVDKMIEQRGGK